MRNVWNESRCFGSPFGLMQPKEIDRTHQELNLLANHREMEEVSTLGRRKRDVCGDGDPDSDWLFCGPGGRWFWRWHGGCACAHLTIALDQADREGSRIVGVVACIRGRLATTFAVREAAARPGSLGAQSATEPLAEGTDKAIRMRRVHRLGEDSINVCGFFKGRV